MNEAADEIATGAQVVDLLVSMCRSALESPRKVVIFEPYPSVVDPNDSQALAFNPRKKDYERVMRALDSLTSIREMTQWFTHRELALNPEEWFSCGIQYKAAGMNKKQQKAASKDETASNSKTNATLQSQKKGQQPQFLQSRNLKCIALCEVITSPDLHKHGDIWVVPNTDHVCTRFFFVYEDGQVGDTSINTQDPSIHKEILRVIGNQTATG
ncbi:UNVERIFIED_CONTAM: hypothetical protein FKN15_039365 [Acipenser sinensis]